MRANARASSRSSGSGLCTRIPCTAGSALSAVDQGVELGLRRRRGELVVKRLHARLGRLLVLAPDVDLGAGIGTHEHGREARLRPSAGDRARARPRQRAREPTGQRRRRRESVRSWRPRVDDRRDCQSAAVRPARIIRTGDPPERTGALDTAATPAHAEPWRRLGPVARRSADARRVAGPSDACAPHLRAMRGSPERGANPRDACSRWCQYEGPRSAKCGASRRAPHPSSDYTRGHELQHSQPGHRRRARDRGDRRGAHLHEQRAERRQGRTGARQGATSPAWTCRPARRRRTSLHGAT